MLTLLCPKPQYPIQAGRANRRTDMNKPDAASSCPILCSQAVQSRLAGHKANLFSKPINKKEGKIQRKASH